MRLFINSIPEEGMTIHFDASQAWVSQMIDEVFLQKKLDKESFKGSVLIRRVDDILSLHGQMQMKLHSICDRCLEPFWMEINVPFHMDLSPLFHLEHRKEKYQSGDEVELTLEDLEFCFYEGNEIDLKKILREQLVLGLPINYYCSTECKGLCPQCGTNLNQGSCSCLIELKEASPWSVLKKFKADNRG